MFYRVFMRNKILFIVLILSGFLVHCSRQEDLQQEMNIIFITADTLRADHLGCYGYNTNTSPYINALASKSIQFMDVSSVINNTNPSHISMFTSQYPKSHKVYTNWKSLGKEHVTLAEILKNQGYKTAAFVSASHLDSNISGLGKGFDFYSNTQKTKVNADETLNKSLAWMKSNTKEKFFIWTHFFDPHLPYNPPPPYDSLFDPYYHGWGRIFFDVFNHKASPNISVNNPDLTPIQKDTLARMMNGNFNNLDMTYNRIGLRDRDITYVKSLYDGEIKFMDYHIGILLDQLGKMNLTKKTIIIFTADHGESLGEHGIYWGHKGIYEPSIKIPLIIHIPGMSAQEIKATVTNMDILPTILDLLKLPVNTKTRQRFDGKSMMPLIEGKTNTIHEMLFIEQSNNMAKAIKKNDFKYINPVQENFPYFPNDYRHQEGLYHLKPDPDELHNLVPMGDLQNNSYQDLRQNLLLWAGKTWSTKEDSEEIQKLEESQKEKLKSLGYIN